MEKCLKSISLAIVIILLNGLFLHADATDSSTLIEEAKKYDSTQVVYEGEVIGDIMKRGQYTWINAHDGANAIGVWLPAPEANKISYAGSYRYQGDIVRITGEFHRACSQHGGDLDIHASKLEVVEAGYINNISFDMSKVIWAIILSGVALGTFLYTRKKEMW